MLTTQRTRGLIGLSLLLMAASLGAQPRVYRWVDANGVVHFSDAPPPESAGISAATVVVPSSAPALGAPPPASGSRAADAAPQEAISLPPAPQASAAALQGLDCSTPSPQKSSGRDLYDLNYEPPPPLTAEQLESFETVIENLSYRWTGIDVGFACDGGARRALNRSVVAEGRASSRDGFELIWTVSSRDSKNRSEVLRIRLREQQLWVGGGYATLIAISNRMLEFGYNEKRAGVVWEKYCRIETDGRRAMQVEQVTFTNGALTESSVWQTTKPY